MSGTPPIVVGITGASGAPYAVRLMQQLVAAHLNAMALRLGELQARMMRLDGLGEHLAKVAGLNPQELPSLQSGQVPGRGGAESSLPSRALSGRVNPSTYMLRRSDSIWEKTSDVLRPGFGKLKPPVSRDRRSNPRLTACAMVAAMDTKRIGFAYLIE